MRKERSPQGSQQVLKQAFFSFLIPPIKKSARSSARKSSTQKSVMRPSFRLSKDALVLKAAGIPTGELSLGHGNDGCFGSSPNFPTHARLAAALLKGARFDIQLRYHYNSASEKSQEFRSEKPFLPAFLSIFCEN